MGGLLSVKRLISVTLWPILKPFAFVFVIVILPEKSKGLLVFSPPTTFASNVLDFPKLYVLSKSLIAFKISLSSTAWSPSAYHFSIAFAKYLFLIILIAWK